MILVMGGLVLLIVHRDADADLQARTSSCGKEPRGRTTVSGGIGAGLTLREWLTTRI